MLPVHDLNKASGSALRFLLTCMSYQACFTLHAWLQPGQVLCRSQLERSLPPVFALHLLGDYLGPVLPLLLMLCCSVGVYMATGAEGKRHAAVSTAGCIVVGAQAEQATSKAT